MPKKKVAPKAKAKAKVDKKYGYLPKDLQQVGQYMDRVAFLRSLQKKQAVRQYAHVTSQTDGPGSGLSEHGAVGLGEKISMAVGPLLRPKAKALFSKPTPYGMTSPDTAMRLRGASAPPRARSRSPRISAEAGSSHQPMLIQV
jgi:hypothetical protein